MNHISEKSPSKTVNEHIEITSGFAFKSKNFVEEGQLPVIRIRDVKRGFSTTYYSGKYDNKYLIKNGDLLVGMDGEFNAGIWRGGDALLNQRVCKVKPLPTLDFDYLRFILPTKLKQIEDRTSFATVKHISVRQIKDIEIPFPLLEEQKRIAAILDKADAIRRKRKEAIALTEELLRSTFLDMFGDPVGINKQWKKHNLSNFVSIVSGQVDPQTEPYIDMSHIGGDNIESNTGFIHKVQTPRELKLISGKYLFEPTDILYSKIRPYLNKVSIPGFVGVCSADIYPLRVDESIVDREYLVYLLRSSEFLSYAEKHSARTNIPKINRPALLKFTSKLPPLELQKNFSQIYRNVLDTKKNLNSSIKESNNLFNSLLQKAFRGEL